MYVLCYVFNIGNLKQFAGMFDFSLLILHILITKYLEPRVLFLHLAIYPIL